MGSVMAIKDSELSIVAAATVESHDRQWMVGRGGTFSSNFDTSNQISTVRNGIFNCRWILRIKVLIFAELTDSNRPRIGIGGSLTAPPLPHHRAYGSRTTAIRLSYADEAVATLGRPIESK